MVEETRFSTFELYRVIKVLIIADLINKVLEHGIKSACCKKTFM